MKLFSIVMVIFLFSLYPNQTEAQIAKGSIVVEGYYGYSIASAMDIIYLQVIDNNSIKRLGPLGLRFEYMFSDVVGVGLDGSYYQLIVNNSNMSIANQEDLFFLSKTRIMMRMNFHFVNHKSFDAYAGYGIGYKHTKYFSDESIIGNNLVPIWSILVPVAFRISSGVRYFFTENIGIHAEAGIGGGSVVTAGLSYKF